MTYVYREEELPENAICTERLYDMLQFKEYKGFITKCRIYCENRNMSLDQYIDDPKYLSRYNRRIYFLPLDLAIGIVENVRMQNPNRGKTLSYLYGLRGEKVHIQLQERKAEEFVSSVMHILGIYGIKSYKEYSVTGKDKQYRIDLYIPEYKLAIEYDEAFHTEEKDTPREEEISRLLGCNFVRVKDSDTLAFNIGKVLKECLVNK